MSRNKAVLVILALLAIYFLIPSTPHGLLVKTILIRLATYALVVLLIYAIISLNMLKKAMRNLAAEVSDENVARTVKLLRYTFDAKRMFGVETFKSLYNQVNGSKKITSKSKEDFYNAMLRKKINVPLPSKGKSS
ncbi:MAG: hypothetical protein RR131_03195 [Anaerovorax sp.]